MEESHKQLYATLTSAQTAMLWRHLHDSYILEEAPPPDPEPLALSELLYDYLDLTHAEVVLCCASQPGEEWETLLSTLLTRPIYKCHRGETGILDPHGPPRKSPRPPFSELPPRVKAFGLSDPNNPTATSTSTLHPDHNKTAWPRARNSRSCDPRVLDFIQQPNPKNRGSASYRRFELYRVGMTVDEFVMLGGTRADITHDLRKGFITLIAPTDWTSPPARTQRHPIVT